MAPVHQDDASVRRKEGGNGLIVVTASDERYFDLAREMIESLLAQRDGFTIGFLDLGLRNEQRDWLNERGVRIASPVTLLDIAPLGSTGLERMGLLVRPFLRENFPGHEIYVWLDADTWIQDGSVIDDLADGARSKGAAMVRQNESAYRFRLDMVLWMAKHFVLGFGLLRGLSLLPRPHINAGVYAMRSDAPHWEAWAKSYQIAINRTHLAVPYDQFALNDAVYLNKLPTAFLLAMNNWICDLADPMWSDKEGKFCVPYAPYTPIALMHLANTAKSRSFDIRTTAGNILRGAIRFGSKRETVPRI